ncbi:uncharacterized protein LY89DRAFT_664143 [Mollisia scopiformis]|uniref:Uncharacterized protein n=1 Tax=Mollisia scopiformis TaxID=149040 RepID=A0A194XQ70_MOLSC|nr:uncharacterized protein LY89DRAFT_664143 [Mollisia scopiformis]KUJ22306.1 hypothetical protein LY89DRAFT_664143 [Mollisia scopiformis]
MGGERCGTKTPRLGLWTHDSRYPRIFPRLENLSLSLDVDGDDDEDMTDIEDWAFLYSAAAKSPAFCGVCNLELDEHNSDVPMIGCDGGYCENSWYHFLCVGLLIAPTSVKILNPLSDEKGYSSESLADYGGLFVWKESDDDSSDSDHIEELSQPEEEDHGDPLIDWKGGNFTIGSDCFSDSTVDSDLAADEDEMFQDMANEKKSDFNDNPDNSDIREGGLSCQFPDCVNTFMGATFASHYVLARHAKQHDELTLICHEPQCSGRRKFSTKKSLATHCTRFHEVQDTEVNCGIKDRSGLLTQFNSSSLFMMSTEALLKLIES